MKKNWTILDFCYKNSNSKRLIKTEQLIKLRVPGDLLKSGQINNKYILVNTNTIGHTPNINNYGILNLESKNISLNSKALNKTDTPILKYIISKDKTLLNNMSIISSPLKKGSQPNKLCPPKGSSLTGNLLLLQSNAKFANKYKGLQFQLAGRLRGAQRANKLQINHGRISSQTFNSSLLFNKKQIYTKWGTWGSSIYVAR